MNKNAVIVCSNAGLDYIEHTYNIPVFRSVIRFGEEEYSDYVDLTAEEFYKRIETDKTVFPNTAFVSLGKMIETFEDLKKQGYTGCLVICISAKLSGLLEGVKLASQEVDNFDINVFDSKTLAYPEAYMALEAARMFEDNKPMVEVIKHLDFIRTNQHIIFAVDTLEYLVRNGRLSKFAGALGQMMSIRPLLHFDPDGKIEVLEKTRTSKKARSLMVKRFLEEIEGKNVITFISHAHAIEEVKEVKAMVLEMRPDIGEIKDYYLTPVVGAHVGPRGLGLGYIVIKEN